MHIYDTKTTTLRMWMNIGTEATYVVRLDCGDGHGDDND